MALDEHVVGRHEKRPDARDGYVATATLACPACDAPVAPPAGATPVTSDLACPYCGCDGAVRDFVSFDRPARPARVVVRIRRIPAVSPRFA